MKSVKVIFTTTILAISLIFSGLLSAQEILNTGNIYIGGVGYFSDTDRNIDDDLGIVLGGELPLSERWSVSSDLYKINSHVKFTSGDADLDFYRLGLNYHFNQINGWQPYLAFGTGYVDQEAAGFANDETEHTLDVGLGLKRMLNDKWMLRGDYKLINGEDVHGFDNALSFGIAYTFGKRASASRPSTSSTMMDSDNDGVPDSSDACRNTPAGIQVDSRGCPIMELTQRRQELLVNFDYDRSEVKPQYDSEIKDFAEFMEVYVNTNVVIEGHTDSRGSDAYNQALSERRANAVRDELVNENGIAAERVSTVGYGESRPVSSNNTDAGRAQNRRIEAVISVEVEEQRRR